MRIIGEKAFYKTGISSVEFPNTLQAIREQAFAHNELRQLNIPSSVSFIGAAAFNVNQLPDDQAFIYARKAGGNEDKTTLVSYGGAKRTDVQIPNTIKILDVKSFYANEISSVQVNTGITTIKEYAFDENNLTSLVLPETVKTIASKAFFRNPNLKQIQLLSSTAHVGACAFGCSETAS